MCLNQSIYIECFDLALWNSCSLAAPFFYWTTKSDMCEEQLYTSDIWCFSKVKSTSNIPSAPTAMMIIIIIIIIISISIININNIILTMKLQYVLVFQADLD